MGAHTRDRRPASFWRDAPDFTVEVAPPSGRFTALQTKMAEYFRAGTRLVWIVEPWTRTVHEYRELHERQGRSAKRAS